MIVSSDERLDLLFKHDYHRVHTNLVLSSMYTNVTCVTAGNLLTLEIRSTQDRSPYVSIAGDIRDVYN